MTVLAERKAHIFARQQHDHYVEPSWTSERLFDVEDFEQGSTILDPCCGWCRIPAAAARAGYRAIASDIVDRRASKTTFEFQSLNILAPQSDATYKWWRQARSIVSNPPFDQICDVARRCCALAEYKVALICPLRRLPAAGSWLRDLPLSKVWIISPRPSMPTGDFIKAVARGELDPKTGKPLKVSGGTVDFVWLIFEKSHRGPPKMDWLYRDARDTSE